MASVKRATVYFDESVHKALRLKAAETDQSISLKRSAAMEIEAIPIKDRKRIISRIQSLADNPRPVGSEKLSGEDKYRLRQGGHRIVYEIVDIELVITVVKVGNRRDVYR